LELVALKNAIDVVESKPPILQGIRVSGLQVEGPTDEIFFLYKKAVT
jgi:hypothetical protein